VGSYVYVDGCGVMDRCYIIYLLVFVF